MTSLDDFARAACLLVCAGLFASIPAYAQAVSSDPMESAQAAIANLPSPYSSWNVQVHPKPGEAGTLVLTHDSPALQRRSATSLYLPIAYSTAGPPLAVMYFLHGTVISIGAAVEDNPQVLLENFPSQRAAAQFVVAAVDVDVRPTGQLSNWCQTCAWIDGRNDSIPNLPPAGAPAIPAETVLYAEVIPLIERVFNVRVDRGGRGVMGFSMGALGTLLQGFRHPDRYSYVAAISGVYDIVDEPVASNFINTVGYLRDQGYGTPLTHAVWWRNFNPRDLIGNFVGSGTALMLSAGDQCLPPTDEQGAADCAALPPLLNPVPTAIETMIRHNTDLSINQISAAGVVARQVRFSGVHGANNHRVYAQVIVPTANQIFAADVTEPGVFSFRTADPRFSIWGYDITAQRSHPAFLAIEGASQAGTSFSLRGNGAVTVLTPPEFIASHWYVVTYSSSSRQVEQREVQARDDGRLQLQIDLDRAVFSTGAGLIIGLLGGDASGYARVSVSKR